MIELLMIISLSCRKYTSYRKNKVELRYDGSLSNTDMVKADKMPTLIGKIIYKVYKCKI